MFWVFFVSLFLWWVLNLIVRGIEIKFPACLFRVSGYGGRPQRIHSACEVVGSLVSWVALFSGVLAFVCEYDLGLGLTLFLGSLLVFALGMTASESLLLRFLRKPPNDAL